MACIYKITNLINGKIYIGKTKFNANRRFTQHCTEANRKLKSGNPPLHKAIIKYGKSSFSVSEICSGSYSEDEINLLEKKYIVETESYKRDIGYNMTMGGECFPIKMWTEERRLKQSRDRSGEGNPMFGKSRKGDNNHSEYKKIVWVYITNGDFVECHNGIRSLARKLNVNSSAVKFAIRRSFGTCNGFILSYKELNRNDIISREIPNIQPKVVYRISKKGIVEKKYDNIYSVRSDGFCKTLVSRCCNGRNFIHKGYYWSFDQTGSYA
jgi:group I intron endonuclease